mmetsp:Transcript_29623/g.33005  ORF Transcript_29623/g.33005 Transcript_29623/m.33005 type:complete len:205 (+) Transcript_29623:111-725(+)
MASSRGIMRYTVNIDKIGSRPPKRTSKSFRSAAKADNKQANFEADPWELFTLDYSDSLAKFFGKNTRPILYALCMVTKLGIGVESQPEDDTLFQVTNHAVFMLGINIFTSQKSKRPRNEYSTYRSMSRWVQMLDNRKKGRRWRFQLRYSEAAAWQKVNSQISKMLHCYPHVRWSWKCDNSTYFIGLNHPSFGIHVNSIAWACSL